MMDVFWVNSALTLVLAAVAFIVKRAISTVDVMSKRIEHLEKQVAILLDRDRMRRLTDYSIDDGK